MNRLPWIILLALAGCLSFAFACDDDDDDNDNDDNDVVDDDDTNDDDDDNDDQVDAVSSASPERDSAVLKSSHAGWQKAGCLSCHEGAHLGGFTDGECVTCHGNNGAPQRAAGHASRDCVSCHSDRHPDLTFTESQCIACHKYVPSDDCPATEDVDVVVIGSGGGGVAAANALAQQGLSVVLVEKHYKVGGYMTTFNRGDYTFEASLHAMGGLDDPDNAKGAWEEFHKLGMYDRVKPLKCDPIYRSEYPGLSVQIPADIDAYKAQLKEMYPAEAAGLDALFADLDTCDVTLSAVTRIMDDFNLDDLLILLGDLPGTLNLLKYMNISLLEYVQQFVSDPELIGLFNQLCTFLGGGPDELQALIFIAMWNGYHKYGYYYFEGGSKSVTQSIADVFTEHAGYQKLNTLATKIVIEDGKAVQVRTENDVCLNTRYVVSNANAPDTMLKLVGAEYLPEKYVTELNSMSIGVATLQVFMGVDYDYTSLVEGSHEIMINPSWDWDEIFAAVQAGDLQNVPLIAANYTAIDPTTAPAGKNVIVISTYLPYEYADNWQWTKSYDEYIAFKEEIAQVFIERMEAYLPGLSQHIEVLEVGTPVTNYAFSLNPKGTILGWDHNVEQSTLKRLPQETPIENLILAGAWTFPGGGQSAVISSGIGAAGIIADMEAGRK